jgi:hypothetical protein
MTEGGGEQIPALDNVLDMELDADGDRRYLVLYDEDYEDLLLDAEDSVALLVNCNQAVEVLRLASTVVADLAPEHAPDKEPIHAMIEALQEVRQDGE